MNWPLFLFCVLLALLCAGAWLWGEAIKANAQAQDEEPCCCCGCLDDDPDGNRECVYCGRRWQG